LSSENLAYLLQGLNYCRGFKFNNFGIEASSDCPFYGTTIGPDFQNHLIKNDRTESTQKKAQNFNSFSFAKFGFTSVEANLSCPFVGINGYYSQETNTNIQESGSSSFYYRQLDVKKGQVNLSPFRNCREEFLNYFHGKEINKCTLNEFIDRYGAFVIDTITVGGSLYTIETGTTDFQGHQEEKKDNAGVGGKKFSSNLELK
jgi:hypothetical protein